MSYNNKKRNKAAAKERARWNHDEKGKRTERRTNPSFPFNRGE
ncbi:MAG: hypothetical protein ACXADS_15400 [Candidatus Thorarchaeota archaeon]|jgi:hypothetical protein